MSYAADPAARGEAIFRQKCLPCHTVGGGTKVGPDLSGVTRRRDRAWLVRWIMDPGVLVSAGDSIALDIIKGYAIRMPASGLSEEEIGDVLGYVAELKRPAPPATPLRVERKASAEIALLSRTYMQFYEDPRGNKYGPLYERMDLDLAHAGKRWAFHASGLMRYDLRTRTFGNREMDELTYACATITPFTDERFILTLGRQYAVAASAEHMDGAGARWEFTRGAGISVFGGRPVRTAFDGDRGDYVLGGRVYQRLGSSAEVGISLLHEDHDAMRFREEAGMDIWALPWGMVEIQGRSVWNNATRGWMEHAYDLRLPREHFVVSVFFNQTNYANAFSARTLSVFSPDLLGAEEGLTKAGVRTIVRLSREVTVTLEGTRYDYRKTGDAMYYGGSLAVSPGTLAAGLSLHRMDGGTGRLRYTEARGYAKKSFGSWQAGMDAINLHYDDRFGGPGNAYAVKGMAAYSFSRQVSAGADIDFGRDPDFTHRVAVLLKLVYNFRREL